VKGWRQCAAEGISLPAKIKCARRLKTAEPPGKTDNFSGSLLWIRIRSESEPKLFARFGSEKNLSGPEPGCGMHLIKNLFNKIQNVSTKCTIKKPFFKKKLPKKLKITKYLVYVLKNFRCRRNFRNKARVCRAILPRRSLIQ
jgi:hypothetical protein